MPRTLPAPQNVGIPFPTTRNSRLSRASATVFSHLRVVAAPKMMPPVGMKAGERQKMEGVRFLKALPTAKVPVAFFDPQYRGILDKQKYGNEGVSRQKTRAALPQMSEESIAEFIAELERTLIAGGHLFLWLDKFHLCNGFSHWYRDTELQVVDMVVWDKGRLGMGYRTRRRSEYLVALQKKPIRAKGVWQLHDIPDVWKEKAVGSPHPKPVMLQARLIEAVSHESDWVIDPAAGSFSVLEACRLASRRFLGCDING